MLVGENVSHVTCQKYVHMINSIMMHAVFWAVSCFCATAELCDGYHQLNSADESLLVSCWPQTSRLGLIV